MSIELHNVDCMEYMRGLPDNAFELAIVDPPYGLEGRVFEGGGGKNTQSRKWKAHRNKGWDDAVPAKNYWKQLFRVSKNQIVWGGNYFGLPPHRTFIVWDKMTYIPSMSRVEQAWTSFDSPAVMIQINSNQQDRIHPTQKPVKLYEWLLMNYAKEGDRILDTHLGSGSSAIAAHNCGFDFVGCELDTDYFNAASKRLKQHQAQLTIPID